MIKSFQGKTPSIGKNCFVAETAVLIGDVTLGDGCSVWYGAVLRGDLAPIRIGSCSNIQDNCTLHTDIGAGLVIGDRVTVGHGAVIHSSRIDDNCLIGMGAVLLDRCHIGEASVVGAASLVTQNKEFPPYSLIIGSPAKAVRELPPESVNDRIAHAEGYGDLARLYQKEDNK